MKNAGPPSPSATRYVFERNCGLLAVSTITAPSLHEGD
jgi:hypothetical protein